MSAGMITMLHLGLNLESQPTASMWGHSCLGVCQFSQVCTQSLIFLLDVTFDKFNLSKVPLPDYALILKMDWFFDAGVTGEQFSWLFIQCDECHTCLPHQNIFYHACDQALAQHQKVLSHSDKEYPLEAQIYGLPVDRFSAVFASCRSCNKFMTCETSHFHDCIMQCPHL